MLGRTLDLNGHPFVIVGVIAPEFAGLDASPQDVWVPITMHEALVGKDLFNPENVDAPATSTSSPACGPISPRSARRRSSTGMATIPSTTASR